MLWSVDQWFIWFICQVFSFVYVDYSCAADETATIAPTTADTSTNGTAIPTNGTTITAFTSVTTQPTTAPATNGTTANTNDTSTSATVTSAAPGNLTTFEPTTGEQMAKFGVDNYRNHHHHIRFWYLRCCGCPGLRGRQHLATPHTRSP